MVGGEVIVLSDGTETFQSYKLGLLPSVIGGTTVGVVDGPEYSLSQILRRVPLTQIILWFRGGAIICQG